MYVIVNVNYTTVVVVAAFVVIVDVVPAGVDIVEFFKKRHSTF